MRSVAPPSMTSDLYSAGEEANRRRGAELLSAWRVIVCRRQLVPDPDFHGLGGRSP